MEALHYAIRQKFDAMKVVLSVEEAPPELKERFAHCKGLASILGVCTVFYDCIPRCCITDSLNACCEVPLADATASR